MKTQTEERLAAIIESSFDAIISKDLSGTIVSWNSAAEQMFGYDEQEAVGKPIFLIVPDDRHDEETKILRRLHHGERIETFETYRRHRDGRAIPVSITISPIKNKEAVIVGASTIARDISKTRESERRLRLLMREINHRVKNQFAVVLAIIRQTAGRSTSIDEFEARIRERVMALSHSHDLLSQVDWAGVDLADLISHQLQAFKDMRTIQTGGPSISLDANAVLNIGMAIHELVINAIRFSTTGGEGISVTWRILNAAGGEAENFELVWSEPAMQSAELPLQQEGFGALVLRRLVPSALSGHAIWCINGRFVRWTLTAPLSRIRVNLLDQT